VKWTWAGTFFHNVESGVGSVPDGIFSSGAPFAGAGHTFSVTFDAAFLAAHPVTNNNYDYYCIVHEALFGMSGVVRVTTPYGCTAPAGSMKNVNSDGPHVNQIWQVAVNNPVPGGQTPGSLAFVGIATAPAPGFPCGLALPGFHMDPAQPLGRAPDLDLAAEPARDPRAAPVGRPGHADDLRRPGPQQPGPGRDRALSAGPDHRPGRPAHLRCGRGSARHDRRLG
jgi:hypothetical protein